MNALKINPADNVAVAIEELAQGELVTVDGVEFELQESIPAGHKFALTAMEEGDKVVKYGYPIGRTLAPIRAGEWINEKKIRTNLEGVLDYEYHPQPVELEIPEGAQTGEVVRAPGLGMPRLRDEKRGDMLVQLVVATPKKLSRRQRELLEEFAALGESAAAPEPETEAGSEEEAATRKKKKRRWGLK